MADTNNEFADAFMREYPKQADKTTQIAQAKGLAHPQAFAGLGAMNSDGFCSLWKKYEPQAESALGWLKLVAPGPATFMLALLQAAKTTLVPMICGGTASVVDKAPTGTVKTNVSQKASG